ncbi:zinc finger CCCH domain-containing protein 18-like isoform X2 [Benincasa hispida]|nr:zinc finger CCCH domain-containing protein 18-like isoform X2 [Benincasa hispida]
MHMEFSDYTRVVFHRISKIDPENVKKIIGFLLLHDHGDQEMARLALGPDSHIQEVIMLAKNELHQLRSMPAPVSPPSLSPSHGGFISSAIRNRQFSTSPPGWEQPQLTNKPTPDYIPLSYSDSMYELHNPHFFCLDDHMEPSNSGLSSFDCRYVENAAMVNSFITRNTRHYSNVPEFQPRTCHYFNKGFCKHGSSCRYLHSGSLYNSNSNVNDDHVFRPGSLERLEFEIVELLKSRRGSPISIASLPMIYYEKYGKVLQAEGYLTESQRHGKSGFSLTKLLTRLKSSIQVIDRPHGQHAVILAEDAPKFMDHRKDKNDPGPIVSSARQIYMTFPADSTFTEDDVSDYFSVHYGLVEDVRIPCQQRRMFGFVTFHSIETVKLILSDDSEHLICGARVLVKPYREKSKLLERKYQERIEQQNQDYFSSRYNNLEPEQLHLIARGYDFSPTMLRLRMEEQQQRQQQQHALERSLSEMTLIQKSVVNQPYFSYQMNELKLPVPEERFDHLMDILNVLKSGSGSSSSSSSITDENKQPRNVIDWNHIELNLKSEGYNLPESPFETSTGNNT